MYRCQFYQGYYYVSLSIFFLELIMTKEYSPYPFRMPAVMREEIEQKAKASNRSLQQEMLKRLELSLSLEKIFVKQADSVDSLEPLITNIWGKSISAEKKIEKLQEQIVNLTEINRRLVESSKIDDTQRIDSIRRIATRLDEAVEQLKEILPPIEYAEPIQKKPYNPRITPNELDSDTDLDNL